MPQSALSETGDSSVIRRAAAGDPAARDELFRRFDGRLHQIAHQMLRRNPRLARWEQTDDLRQMACVRLHQSLSDANPRNTREFFGLAVVQIRRLLIDLARHHFGPHGDGAHRDERSLRLEVQTDQPNAEQDILEAWTTLHKAIDQLPELEREVFGVVWYGGVTQREAAELLEVSERTVLRRIHRARLLLAERLKDVATDLGRSL